MSSEISMTYWIDELKRGNSAAAEAIWKGYFPQLVRLAREQLRGMASRMADEEDVALSALDSFCRAAQRGCFPDLADRAGLWRLLFQKTLRKAINLARHEKRQVRGGGRVRVQSDIDGPERSRGDYGLDHFPADETSPDLAAMVADECRHLLSQLDPELQDLALAKMEGHSNEQIAQHTGRSVRTIERRLQLIRRKWEEGPVP